MTEEERETLARTAGRDLRCVLLATQRSRLDARAMLRLLELLADDNPASQALVRQTARKALEGLDVEHLRFITREARCPTTFTTTDEE